MNLQLITKDVRGDVTQAMRDVLSEKMAFLEKLVDNGPVKVTISREGKGFNVTAQYSIRGRFVVVSSGIFHDAYEALDELVSKAKELTKGLRHDIKKMEKTQQRREKYVLAEKDTPKEPRSGIVRRKKFSAKPMTEEGAIAEMESLGHDSFIFMNSELDDKICMLYTRYLGGYGLIEIE